jgi:hypothetical protein
MARLGLKGIGMMAACAAGIAVIMRWGGAWETFARVFLCLLLAVMGAFGLIVIGMATFGRKNICETPGCRSDRGIRFCDYRMVNDQTCGRNCCQDHVHVMGNRDLCQGHFEGEI